MRITLISAYYWPESFGAGVWVAEMAEWLVAHGHRVTVITGFPNHPVGEIFPEYRGRVFQQEVHNGVKIVRTWIYPAKRTPGLLKRIAGQLSFSVSLLMATIAIERPEVVWCMSPPLPGALTSWLLSVVHRTPLVLNISDIEPERSISLGLIRGKKMIALLNAMERLAYHCATAICVLSEGTKRWLVHKGVSAEKIYVTPNWADGDFIRPLPRDLSYRSRLGIGDEFVVLYSGNIGYTMQDLSTLIDAARLLQNTSGVRFVIAGDGVRREEMEDRAKGLRNVQFLPIQPRQDLPSLMATADIAVVVVCDQATHASVPSKIYSLMAAGRPVLAICNEANDAARIISEANCGTHVLPGNARGLADVILSYREDPTRAICEGERARKFFELHFTPEICIQNYEAVFQQLVRGQFKSATAVTSIARP